jgi:hypothetical protein
MWLKKLNNLADSGNQDAKALLQKSNDPAKISSFKIMAAAGDDDAANALQHERDVARRYIDKKKAKIKESDPKKHQTGGIAQAELKATAEAGDEEAKTMLVKAEQKCQSWISVQKAKAKSGDPQAIAVIERHRKYQREYRMGRRKSARASDKQPGKGKPAQDAAGFDEPGDVVEDEAEEEMEDEQDEEMEDEPEASVSSPTRSTSDSAEAESAVSCNCEAEFGKKLAEERTASAKAIEDSKEKARLAKEAEMRVHLRNLELERRVAHLDLELLRARQRRV